MLKLYGLLITKDDEAIFDEWCQSQLALYDAVVCLDGSNTDLTETIAYKYPNKLIYLHERDFDIPHKTDHGLRNVVHQEIVQRFGRTDNWIMCCHADEFCYHSPRRIVAAADRMGYDGVSWYSLQFYPHPEDLKRWPQLHDLPVVDRVRYFHWNRKGSGFPHIEDRLYKNSRRVFWKSPVHANTRPVGIRHIAPFHPVLQHYKVFTTDLAYYELDGQNTRYRTHWQEQANRTGLPLTVKNPRDLFVDKIPNFETCSYFDDTLPYRWNIGDKYRLAQGERNGSKARAIQ